MKKKIFPLFLVFILCFSGVLALQIVWDRLQNGAGVMNERASEYEKLFLNERFEAPSGALVRPKDIKAPVVVLIFWAKYCLPCHEELKALSAFQKSYTDEQIFFLGINEDPENQAQAIEQTRAQYALKLLSLEDKESLIGKRYGVDSLPTAFIFVQGRFVKRIDGPIEFEKEPWEQWVKNP